MPSVPRAGAPARCRWVTAAAALLCLLVAGNARASIQGRHVSARVGHDVTHARCLPAPPHADPCSSGLPCVAVFPGGRPSGSHVLVPLRVLRAPGALGAGSDRHGSRSAGNPRAVATLPSHWGSTHLSV